MRPLGNAIFVLGIAQRSGTNFLQGLLRLHPDCRVPKPIWEDYFLEPSHLLTQYTHAVYRWWEGDSSAWGVDESFEQSLRRHIGEGLLSYLASRAEMQDANGRLLTKTPNVGNLENFFHFFPDAYLLILVRDGRDVVESATRSFDAWRDGITRQWADGAETILRFDRAHRAQHLRYMIVRYEDIVLDLDRELPKILSFLDLDLDVYDFEAARELPVKGSSTYQRGKKDRVQWEKPLAKSSDFNPIARWRDWDRIKHERFNWIAGQYLTQFGYEMKTFDTHRRVWGIYNRGVDAVGRHRLHKLMPSFLWRLIKKAGYGLFRLVGVEASKTAERGT